MRPTKSMLATILSLVVAAAAICSHPAYAGQARDAVVGDLRVTGPVEMEQLLAAWRAGFEARHPDTRIVANLKGRASAIYGLEVRTADIALMDRPLHPFERYGIYERSWTYPVEIEFGTGGVGATSPGAAYAIYVHPKNPLRQLTVEQLDGIFGARRDGGWNKLAWDKSAARGAEQDLRTWGQLGVRGALRNRAIHPYGPAIEGQGVVNGFQNVVLRGGAKWNEDYREYADRAAMFSALQRDPAGIAYAQVGLAPKGWVPLAIAARNGQQFVGPTEQTVADRSYPLARPLYLYFTVDSPSGDPVGASELIRAFARYVLSAEGQAVLARATSNYVLPPAIAGQQRARIESDAWPVERPKP